MFVKAGAVCFLAGVDEDPERLRGEEMPDGKIERD
jgi:hypothetical protein